MCAAPVPADVRMRKVPEPDGFGVVDVDDVAEGGKEGVEEAVVRGVAEDVADGEDGGRAGEEGTADRTHVREVRGEGLFAEGVQVKRTQGEDDLAGLGVRAGGEEG